MKTAPTIATSAGPAGQSSTPPVAFLGELEPPPAPARIAIAVTHSAP